MRKRMLSVFVAIATVILLLPAATIPALAIEYFEAIPPKYDSIYAFSEGLAAVYLSDKGGYIDKTGKEVISIQYDGVLPFSEGLAPVCRDGKYGFVDKTGKEVVPIKYDYVNPFSDGIAHCFLNGERLLIDKSGHVVKSIDNYSSVGEPTDGMRVVSHSGEWGFIDTFGEEIVPLKYDYSWDFSEGFGRVFEGDYYQNSGKNGFVDKNGREVVPLVYEDANNFSDGMAGVKRDGKWGFVDATGQEAVTPKYDEVQIFSEGIAGVNIDGKWGFIDKFGREIVTPKYDYVYWASDGMVQVRLNGLFGFVDVSGHEIVPCKYQNASQFSEGMAAVRSDYKYGYIDKTGNEIIPFKYDKADYFGNGLAGVTLGNYSGFIDRTGREVVPCTYSEVTSISEGMAGIGVGEWVTNPEYNSVRFEGKWGYLALTENSNATPTKSAMSVNGEGVSVDMYLINQENNYLKLRDLATMLSGTDKQFVVGFDGALKTVTITTGAPYTPVGGEMTLGDGTAKNADQSAYTLIIDGESLDLTVYLIDGNNYYKLRDLCSALDVYVVYDNATKAIALDTSKGYTEG